MKNRSLFLITLLTTCFFSCQKESVTANNKEQSVAALNKQSDEGVNNFCNTWAVSSFTQNGNDNSGVFSGYNFVFCSDHTVTVSNGQSTFTGTWRTNGVENGTNTVFFMTISFNTDPNSPEALIILNADWTLVEWTDNIIDLKRSTEDGNLEVIFTKKG